MNDEKQPELTDTPKTVTLVGLSPSQFSRTVKLLSGLPFEDVQELLQELRSPPVVNVSPEQL